MNLIRPADKVSHKVGIIIMKKNYSPLILVKWLGNNFSGSTNFFQKSADPNNILNAYSIQSPRF